jgi:hypothetical protein
VTVGLRHETVRTPKGGRDIATSSRPAALRSLSALGPVLAVAAAAIGIWLATGVVATDILLFAAYQLGFVVLPGWLAYRVLLPEDSLLRSIVFGWVLGYALEIGAYVLAAELHHRGLFAYYPLLAAPLIPFAVRRVRVGAAFAVRGSAWAAAGVGVVALGYLGLAYFARTPFPWDIGKVTYETDIPFSLSLAGEALHHWPMSDPNVSGLPLYYYVAAHVDLAATSRVTGVALPVVLFRLAIVPLTLLVIAQFAFAGRIFTGRAAVGILAAALFLLVGEVDPEPYLSYPFLGLVFVDVWLSPTYLVGLLFFVAAVTFIGERIRSAETIRAGTRRWILVGAFLLMCAAAKPPTLAVLIGGLAVTLVWTAWRERRVNANAAFALAVATAVLVVFYAALYRHSAFGLGVHPFRSFGAMGWVSDLRASIGGTAGWPIGVVVGTLGLFGPQLAGLVALVALRRHLDETRVFLLGMTLVGIAGFVVFHQPGNSQVYFSHYGLVGGTLLAAEGIFVLAAAWPSRVAFRAVATIASATTLAVFVTVYGVVVGLPTYLTDLDARGVLVAIALGGMFVALRRWALPSGRGLLPAAAFVGATAVTIVIWRVGTDQNVAHAGFELVAALTALTALGLLITRRREYALALVVMVATIGALDLPLDHGPTAVDRARAGLPLSKADETGIDRDLYAGLAWIRDHTSPDAVLAVNNSYERSGSFRLPTYFYYSAFAERRVFLEGWLFTGTAWNTLGEHALTSHKLPFRRRARLNAAVFQHADRGALDVLVRDYGVRYLLDDKRQGSATPALRGLGRLVFANPAVAVYKVS